MPKSPCCVAMAAISLSRWTFAIMDAAETAGYILSALCFDVMIVLEVRRSWMWCLKRSSRTSAASTWASSGFSWLIICAMVSASRRLSLCNFRPLSTTWSISLGWSLMM